MSETRLIIAPAVEFQLFPELQPVNGKLQLALGVELTEKGKKQAQTIADAIDTIPRTIYTSPAEEAYLTSQIIAKHHGATTEAHRALMPTESLEGKITTIRNATEHAVEKALETLPIISKRYELGVGKATQKPAQTNGMHQLWRKISEEHEELMDGQSIIVVATQDALTRLRQHIGDSRILPSNTIREYTTEMRITGALAATFYKDYKI